MPQKNNSKEPAMLDVSGTGRASEKHWAAIEERGVYWGINTMVFIYRYFGRWIFTLILYPVMAYFFVAGAQTRKHSKEFLLRAYEFDAQASPFSQKPGLWQSFLHLLSFGNSLIDKIASWLGEVPHKSIEFVNRQMFLDAVEKHQGGIIFASHLGNMELCRAMGQSEHKMKLNVLVHTHHAENFNRVLRKANSNVTAELLQVTSVGPDTAIMLQEKITNGEMIIIVGDRLSVSNPGRNVRLDFLGKPASFPQGPFILAHLLKCPVYLLFCVKESKGYSIHFESFAEKISLPRKTREEALRRVTEAYARRLEYFAVRYPLQWYNFFDFWYEH